MKIKTNINFINLFLIIFLSFFVSCTTTKDVRYEENSEKENSKAKVVKHYKTVEKRESELMKELKISSIERINFEYNSNGKLINKGKLSTVKYDQNGILVETIVYDEKGRIINRYEYKYNKKGLREEALRYNARDKLDKTFSYKYDDLGNRVEAIRKNANGKIEKYYEYEYDENFNLVSDLWYDSDKNLEFRIESEYDEQDKKIISYSYDNLGNLKQKTKYKYNNQKNIIVEEQRFDNNEKLIGIVQYLYKYY